MPRKPFDTQSTKTEQSPIVPLERLERDEKLAVWAFGVLCLWLIGLSLAIGDIRSDIKAIKQNAKDHGQEIVRQIEQPTSPESQQTALLQVAADARQASLQRRKVDEKTVGQLTNAVTSAIQSSPSSAEAWQAASALVSLRPSNLITLTLPPELAHLAKPTDTNLGDCYFRPMTWENIQDESTATRAAIVLAPINLHDCTLYIDDIDAYQRSNLMQHYRERGLEKSPLLLLNLVRVKIVYRGGQVIPIGMLRMYGCTFDAWTPSEPPAKGQKLLEAALRGSYSAPFLAVDLAA